MHTYVCKKVPNMDFIPQIIECSNIRVITNNLESVLTDLINIQLQMNHIQKYNK